MQQLASDANPWWRPLGAVGSADVVHVDLGPDETRVAAALKWLDDDETARWRRFRHPRPQRQFALCRAVLRGVLCDRLRCANEELRFVALAHGKPAAFVGGTPVPLSFNVSHGGNHGLIAFAPRGRLGVDIEERNSRHDPDGPIRKVFTPDEQAALAAAVGSVKTRLFFKLWTLKEAVIKALGTGFSLDTASFEIPRAMYRDGNRQARFELPPIPQLENETGVRWRLDDLGTEDFAAAIALELPREGTADDREP